MFHQPSPTSPGDEFPMITGPTPVTPVGLNAELLRQREFSGSDEAPMCGVPMTFRPECAPSETCIVESEDSDDEISKLVDFKDDKEADAPSEAEVQAARDLVVLEFAPPPHQGKV